MSASRSKNSLGNTFQWSGRHRKSPTALPVDSLTIAWSSPAEILMSSCCACTFMFRFSMSSSSSLRCGISPAVLKFCPKHLGKLTLSRKLLAGAGARAPLPHQLVSPTSSLSSASMLRVHVSTLFSSSLRWLLPSRILQHPCSTRAAPGAAGSK